MKEVTVSSGFEGKGEDLTAEAVLTTDADKDIFLKEGFNIDLLIRSVSPCAILKIRQSCADGAELWLCKHL